jgi:hypothetical protein
MSPAAADHVRVALAPDSAFLSSADSQQSLIHPHGGDHTG